MYEYEIDALYRYVFRREGCADIGYEPIVGSGPNATILHYNTNRRRMLDGELLLVDAAGEFMGYSADGTRTFPVNGKFSPEQRAIYEIVLRATDAGIALCRPGATTTQIGNRISEILADGLIALGIIQSRNQLGRYYMHGFGHGIGLDVHDPMPGTLVPGVVLTVEPGIYIKEGSPCDPKWWNIGIRIEDDIVVTEGDPINLSAGAPRTIADIEKLMQETGIGNQPFRGWK
jgi:Xaa-Pro aminopeptidase